MKLPIEEILPSLNATLARHRSAVLQAPPGAGKTTMVPISALSESWLDGRSILVLEPRRLAARAAAGRMAELLREEVGGTVGYRIRFESRVSSATRIEVLTEGILTRRLQNDPSLEGVGLVIFDEFHERHLHGDLALALTLDCQRGLRDDLKILVMSATLDGNAVARLLGGAPVLTSEGRSYPVDIRYLPRDPEGRIPVAVAAAIQRAIEQESGDLLAFLPGAGEIRRTQELLDGGLGPDVDVFPLYGDLPWEQQQRAIMPRGGRRRVVLATPIAETSLTIDRVRVIVDSGFVRVPQFDPASGLTRLSTQRISRASAEQRAGRAGRTAPGVCYRLWSESTQRGLVPHATPEIRTADLAPLALELAAWGAHDAESLAWLDSPPAPNLAQARDLLQELDALDNDNHLTAVGKAMVRLPLHPRLAHMVQKAVDEKQGGLACDIAALLSERDLFKADSRRSVDITERLEALGAFRQSGRRGAQNHGADPGTCARIEQVARQWRRMAGVPGASRSETDWHASGRVLSLAYPDRIAMQRNPKEPRYLLANGRGATLPDWELRLRQPFLVAASTDAALPGGSGEGRIFLAAVVDRADLLDVHSGHVRNHSEIVWDASQQAVLAREMVRLGALILDERPVSAPDPERIRSAVLDGIRQLGVGVLPWTSETREWQARVLSVRHWFPEEGWPDVSDSSLAESMETWLAPFLNDVTRRTHFGRIDLASAVKSVLDWKLAQALDRLAPSHIEVPSGSRVRLEYKPGDSPVLSVKLQEMFGLADTPRVANGRVPVTLHLLSPARRPIQVTQDLKGFWERTYGDVKKELKGRYPKHPWPDDPWKAVPTARASRRR